MKISVLECLLCSQIMKPEKKSMVEKLIRHQNTMAKMAVSLSTEHTLCHAFVKHDLDLILKSSVGKVLHDPVTGGKLWFRETGNLPKSSR